MNSYVLYLWKCKENHLSVMTQLECRSKLVKELVGNFSCRKRTGPNPRYCLPVARSQGHENVNILFYRPKVIKTPVDD